MSKQDKKRKIKEFIEGDSIKYAEFLNGLDGGVDINEKLDNSEEKKRLEEELDNPEYEHKFMDNGIYGELAGQPPYQELDFEKFSFTVLKEHAENPDLVETIEIIEELPETHRRKELRISLFDRLKDINSPYFDPRLYHEVLKNMLKARATAMEVINEQYEILTIGFDSFSFIATTEEAKQLQKEVNQKLDVGRMTLDTYPSAVKFYNVASFLDEDGEWFVRKSTGTEWDDYKERVVEALQDLDFKEAKDIVAEGKDETDNDYFKNYMADLTGIERQVKSR